MAVDYANPLCRGGSFLGYEKLNKNGKLLGFFRMHDRGWVLSLLLAVGVVYLPFLGNPFVFDDIPFFAGGGAAHYGESGFYFDLRWLPYASLGWTAALFSDVVPHFFHLGNMLLHVANVILIFYLIRELMAAVIPESNSSVVWYAWFGAMIFALHPVAVYGVGYVIQRSILMATFFALAMQLAYLRGLLTGQIRWLVLAVLAYFLAVFSKEHSVMLPAVLAAMTLLLRGKNHVEQRTFWLAWSAFFAIGLLIILRAKGVFGSPYEAMAAALFEQQGIVESTPMLHLLSVMTQAGLFFKYLFLWLLPNPAWMSIDMREHFIPSWTAWQGWLGVIAFGAYGVLALRLLLRGGRKGLLGFTLLYPWLLFLIEFASIRVQEPFVLYRSYLWMPSMMLLFPLLLTKFIGIRPLLLLGLVGVLLVPLAWNRLWVMGDNYRLWNDAAVLLRSEHEAGADRIFFNRGQAQALAHKWDEAAADFERVVALSPQLAPVRFELGMAYLNLQRYENARAQFDAGIAIAPKDGRQYLGKGLALMRLQQRADAQQQFKNGCELGEQTACMFTGSVQKLK